MKTTLHLDATVWKTLRSRAVEEGVSATRLVERLIRDYLTTEQKQKQAEQKQKQQRRPSAASAPRRVLATNGDGTLWPAYENAYRARYGVSPTRNAKVNSLLAQLRQRLPAADAASVIAFYLRHHNALYVRAGHPVDLLVRDAEKLRTEWLTGRMVTETEARELDRKAGLSARYQRVIEKFEQEERAMANENFEQKEGGNDQR